jgi:hypothetical protein
MIELFVRLFIFLVLLEAAFVVGTFAAMGAGVAGVGLVLVTAAGGLGQNLHGDLTGLGLEPAADGEPAFRSYFFGPVFRDFARVARLVAKSARDRLFGEGPSAGSDLDAWISREESWIGRLLGLIRRSDNRWWFVFCVGPIAAAVVGLLAGALAGGVFIGVIGLAFTLLLGLTDLVLITIAGTLRGFERLSLAVRGITVECPTCYKRVLLPVYECPNQDCRARHQHLLPGMLGVFQRICRCGTALPTLLIRRSRSGNRKL